MLLLPVHFLDPTHPEWSKQTRGKPRRSAQQLLHLGGAPRTPAACRVGFSLMTVEVRVSGPRVQQPRGWNSPCHHSISA